MKKVFMMALVASGLSAAPALAGSELLPGISTGIALGAQMPEGVYVVAIPTTGKRDANPDVRTTAVAPAWVIWATGVKVGGAQLLFDTVTPHVTVDIRNGPKLDGWGNTYAGGQLKWDLGQGWFGGFNAGVYLPSDSEVGRDWTSFQGLGAVSYVGEGKNLTATLVYGTGKESAGAADWVNLDLTATKTFGKWELGAVAFASADVGDKAVVKQNQIAAGPLVGYSFGKVKAQAKLTTDLHEKNYGGKETRLWANIIIPVWNK